MALVHLRQATVQTSVTVNTLQVVYETYDVLTDPCVFAQADQTKILADAGLPETLSWDSCTVVSHSIVGRTNRYVLDVVVSG